MDRALLSPYPHLSWYSHGLDIDPPRVFALHEYTSVSHRLIVTGGGDAACAWTTGTHQGACQMTGGSLGFYPCDSTVHSLGITARGSFQARVLLFPCTHMETVCEAEGARHAVTLHVHPVFRDTLLTACAHRLLGNHPHGEIAEDVGAEIAARHMLLQLAALCGGLPPDWRKDTSVFAPRVLSLIVERVDSHLGVRATLGDISSGFGLSPSHFARKFQQSTGLSLNRFIHRRRVRLSLSLLRKTEVSLAQLSLDLGFSSQSHFTRIFSGLTGLTPHQYRRDHRRTAD